MNKDFLSHSENGSNQFVGGRARKKSPAALSKPGVRASRRSGGSYGTAPVEISFGLGTIEFMGQSWPAGASWLNLQQLLGPLSPPHKSETSHEHQK